MFISFIVAYSLDFKEIVGLHRVYYIVFFLFYAIYRTINLNMLNKRKPTSCGPKQISVESSGGWYCVKQTKFVIEKQIAPMNRFIYVPTVYMSPIPFYPLLTPIPKKFQFVTPVSDPWSTLNETSDCSSSSH